MKEIVKATGSILLGLAVVAALLLAFSPLGEFLCGPSECVNEDVEDVGWEGQGRPWALFGFVGFMGTFLSLCALALLFVVGEFTKEEAGNVKYRVGTWYGRRLFAKREAESLEDNGGDPDDPVNLNNEDYDF